MIMPKEMRFSIISWELNESIPTIKNNNTGILTLSHTRWQLAVPWHSG
jgi:hypothetical protein